MFNLPEILTILIGALLALVFIDGIRRALRIKNSSLKVDLIDPEDLQDTNKDFEEEWMQGYSDEFSVEQQEEVNEEPLLDIQPSNALLILHLGSQKPDQFSKDSIKEALSKFDSVYQDKGIFNVLDENGNIAFNILNGKKPGVFVEDTISDDLALVLDPINLLNPLESFDLLINISQSLQDFYGCDLLDEDRNLLTKQMIEHMREQVLEYKRQFLASTG